MSLSALDIVEYFNFLLARYSKSLHSNDVDIIQGFSTNKVTYKKTDKSDQSIISHCLPIAGKVHRRTQSLHTLLKIRHVRT